MFMQFTRFVVTLAMLLALCVVVLGAYTRLTDAGLGCPDWPGCYGHWVLPKESNNLQLAQAQFPNQLLVEKKAWTEMVHRYAAGFLGTLILLITLSMAFKRDQINTSIPSFLLILLIFQAALGMWTVTLKLFPIVVVGHLIGGILIFSFLCSLRLKMSQVKPTQWKNGTYWIFIGLCFLLLQIALGGWVSANYAGIACIGFPTCNGEWIPQLNLATGFNLFSTFGENHQGGLLNHDARLTIQYVHRLGAVITFSYLLGLVYYTVKKAPNRIFSYFAFLIGILILIQFALGIINVVYLLPLWSAVAHNAIAALLLSSLLMMFYLSKGNSYDSTK